MRDTLANRMATLRARLRADDVPDDVRVLVAELLDHATRLEGAVELWEDGARARLRDAPVRAFHGKGGH